LPERVVLARRYISKTVIMAHFRYQQVFQNLTILTGSAMTAMAAAMIAPSLPAMQVHFQHVPQADLLVRLVLTLPALTIALGSLFTGYILDYWGRKPVLLIGLFVYGIAGSAAYLLNDLVHIIISRALLGFSISAVMTACTTLIGDLYSGEKLNRFMGSQGAFIGFGAVLFLVVGGFLADFGWRLPFLVYLISFLVLITAILSIDEPESRISNLLANPVHTPFSVYLKTAGICLIAFTLMIIFYLFPVQIPFYLQSIGPYSSAEVGLAMASLNLISAPVSMRYQFIKRRFSHEMIFFLGFLVWGVGYWMIGRFPFYATICAGLMLTGVGLGFLWPNISVLLVTISPDHIRGRAVGILTVSIFLGQFLSPIALSSLVRTHHSAGSFLWLARIVFLAAILFLGYLIVQRIRFRNRINCR